MLPPRFPEGITVASKLTKRAIDDLQPDPARDRFLWCGQTVGFGLRVKPSGTKTFIIQYRTPEGRTRRYAIGQYGAWTVEQARKVALEKLVEAGKGGDPSKERKAARVRKVKSVAELCEEYLKDAKAGRVLYRGRPKKLGTLVIDEGRINRHITPLLGDKALDELGRREIERFQDQVSEGATAATVKTKPRGRARVTGGAGTASKAVKLLGAMFNYAIRKGWVDSNPCVGVETRADQVRERFLRPEEYARLGKALRDAEAEGANVTVLRAIECLALTGCRRSEILQLRSEAIDAEGRCLRLADTKSGAQLRPCGRVALDLLANQAEAASGSWVFPAGRGQKHVVNVSKTLARIRELAELEDLNLHALRHSYATTANELNYSELTIAGLLGHRAGSVTAKYAHAVDSVLAAAADRVSATIAARMRDKEYQAEVVQIGTGRRL